MSEPGREKWNTLMVERDRDRRVATTRFREDAPTAYDRIVAALIAVEVETRATPLQGKPIGE